MALINGQAIAEKINWETAEKVRELKEKGISPKLAVVLVGNNPASLVYIRQKEKVALQTGVAFELHKFGEDASKKELIKRIKEIQKDQNVSGLIIQLPIP